VKIAPALATTLAAGPCGGQFDSAFSPRLLRAREVGRRQGLHLHPPWPNVPLATVETSVETKALFIELRRISRIITPVDGTVFPLFVQTRVNAQVYRPSLPSLFLRQGRIGYKGQIPSENMSYAGRLYGKHYVVLKDVAGNVLAVYRVRRKTALKRLKRWPEELGNRD
jgi:hypothetical protein